MSLLHLWTPAVRCIYKEQAVSRIGRLFRPSTTSFKMSSSETSSAPRATLWLRSLSLLVLGLGLAAEQGRVVSEATGQCILHSTGPLFDRFGHATGYSFLDPFFCMLLSFFREILIYPAGRAVSFQNFWIVSCALNALTLVTFCSFWSLSPAFCSLH